MYRKDVFYVMSVGGASEASVKGGGRAALRPRHASFFLLAAADPPVCRRDLVGLVVLRGLASAPGIRMGVVSGKAGCRVVG